MAEEQQVAEAPVETGQAPSEDWKASLPEDIRDNQLIHNANSIESLAKTAIHAQSMIGADKIAVPGRWANDDDWNNVYTKLGKPEDAQGYKLELKEGTQVDKDMESWYRGLAHKAGLNDRQANTIFQEYMAKEAELKAANAPPSPEDVEIIKGEAEIALKKEWGKAFDTKMNEAKGVLTEFAPKDFDQLLTKDGVPLGNDPVFIKTLANIGNYINSKLGEDKMVGNKQQPQYTPADAEKEIAALRGDPRDGGPYWDKKHPDHMRTVQQVQELMEYMHPEEE
tara:strand:- start:2126 stop:2968 length:843 start_codon:yes stop_codon:yes gene_type:complete